MDDKKNSDAADYNNFWNHYIEGAMAIVGSVLFGMLLYCVICLWRKRKE